MVGSALLTAYKNAGEDIDLHRALIEMMNRGKSVPGRPTACGNDAEKEKRIKTTTEKQRSRPLNGTAPLPLHVLLVMRLRGNYQPQP